MDVQSTLTRAHEHFTQQQWTQAAALCDEVMADVPNHPGALLLRGMIARRAEDFHGAAQFLERALEASPDWTPALFHLADLRRRTGHLQDACSLLRECVRLDPQNPAYSHLLGDVAFDLADVGLAIESWANAIEKGAKSTSLGINLAILHLEAGDDGAAESACQYALAIDPENIEARFQLARVRRAQGKEDVAKKDYQAILSRHPSHAASAINLANILRDMNEPGPAVLLLRRALKHVPDHTGLQFALGVALSDLGRDEEALVAYREVIACEPGHQQGRENLASLLRRLGQIDESAGELREVLHRYPASAVAWNNLGNLQAEQGEWEEARESFRRVIHLRPEDWLAKLRLARQCPLVYDSVDQIHEYRASLEKTLSALLEGPRPVDVTALAQSGCEPPFNLPFHGMNDRPIKERYAALFDQFPRGEPTGSKESRPRMAIVVTDTNERLFLRSMAGILQRLNPELASVTICCSPRGRDLIEPMLGDVAAMLVLPVRLDLAIRAMREAKFDLIYFWEIATDGLNYFLPFARLAPLQVTSWGIQVTSGVPDIDVYLSSGLLEPPEAAAHYSERLELLSSLPSYQERRPLPRVQGIKESLGFSAGDHLYFCAQNLGKFHPRFDQALHEILDRDGAGRAVITSSRAQRENDRLRARFERTLGACASRVVFVPPLAVADYERWLGAADVVLDPWFFGGVNTTYDAFSFHTPIVTTWGEFQRGRFAAGCYRRMGMDDWIACDARDYIDKAVLWGKDEDARRLVALELKNRSDWLFEDQVAVTGFEETLARLSAQSRRI